MVMFTKRQWRILSRIRRKYKVSLEFLNYNMPNILKFIAYYARRLHFVLRRSAERSRRNNSVILKYNRLMRLLFDEAYRKRVKRRKRNVKQWSKQMVLYLRKTQGVKEYIIIKKLYTSPQKSIQPEEVTKQLKEQLELLKSGKRSTQLIDCSLSKSGNSSLETTRIHIEDTLNEPTRPIKEEKVGEFILNEKTGLLESIVDGELEAFNSSFIEEPIAAKTTCTPESVKSSANILDLLMSKVHVSPLAVKSASNSLLSISENDIGADSGEEFLGFAEDENIPGLMRTPLVPSVFRSKEENAAFVSESLDEYFRENSLNKCADTKQLETFQSSRKLRQANIDGLMTLNCTPPVFKMPAVPESLQKLRTVAERRNFLQKFHKNFKLAIINNEAAIYRELQRKIRQPKTKISSQQAMQANSSQMSFTRHGWQAASFVTTDLNKYFFQKLILLDEKECKELRGVRGNNTEQYKTPYPSRVKLQKGFKCTANCIDCHIAKCLKPLPSYANKKKLCKAPFRAIFKACPLSEKPHQPLHDDDAAEILLSGGGMTVVRLPTVELLVCPELGKSLNDIAKRYLEYIIPHEKITREWAEFSTSTLQVSSVCAQNVRNFKKSFAFSVPYINDRSHILVRRIVDRTEKVDAFFYQSAEQPSWAGLSFAANINKSDSTQVECASLLADMINAVSISCSENSFIKEDPAFLSTSQDLNPVLSKEKLKIRTKPAVSQKAIAGSKKSRLICELRRLNATIIETNAQHKDAARCSKEFCAMGCVCSSLNNGYPLQQHCGKPKCMLKCLCKSSASSQIIRIETDGRSITTEDAYNMRLQATARLARMEKEFTSTVVVTENETLLINETQYDKKRRCTKVPKRYQDYRDTDNEFGRLSPVKCCSTPLIDANESRSSPATIISEVMSEFQEPIYIKDATLRQLKHCSIPLTPFKEIQNMAVWCMVHHLYKCFCGGYALEGKRLLIEKENPKLVSHGKESSTKSNFSSKAYYSFDSTEESLTQPVPSSTPKQQKCNEIKTVYVKNLPTRDSDSDGKLVKHAKLSEKSFSQQQTTPNECNFFKNYFTERENLGCSRFVPVPSRTYRSINRKRRAQILDDIEYIEDSKSQLLLNEHIMRSVYYHKDKLESVKIKEYTPPENKKELMEERLEEKVSLQLDKDEPNMKEKLQEEKQSEYKHMTTSEKEHLQKPCSSSKSKSEILKRKSVTNEDLQPAEKLVRPNESSEDTIAESNEAVTKEKLNPVEDMKLPKISNCYSFQARNACSDETASSMKNQSAMTSVDSLSSFSEGVRENYNEVIKMLNSLVSRKMHDIDNALKRDSKIVPPPAESVLCVLQWKNFIGAFHDGLIYIWEVKMKTRTFLAATITNMIPMVLGALAVISITQSTEERLPLIGRMILQGAYIDESENLAVIMQGRLHYWYIKGFLQPNAANACLRPTPETHPELTKKINTLCSSLIKQRTRELERREALMKKKPKSIVESSQNINQFFGQSDEHPKQEELPKCSLGSAMHKISSSIINNTSNQAVSKSKKQAEALELQNCKNKTFDSTKLNQSLWISNIQLQKPVSLNNDELQIPEMHANDHSWYVLDLCNDFSHIFVPVQKEIVSLDRIQRLILLSVQKQKVIRIQFLKRACFDAFIVPTSERKIYFGPFPLNSKPPLLVLLQSVDGKMMTRETYQWLHKIPRKSTQTTAFWLKQINGHICLDGYIERAANETNNTMEELTQTQTPNSEATDMLVDDDCFIVETNSNLTEMSQNSIFPAIIQSSQATNAVTETSKQSNFSPDGFIELAPQTVADTKNAKIIPTTENRKNFVIQTTKKGNGLEIIPSDVGYELKNELQVTEIFKKNLISSQEEVAETIPIHLVKKVLKQTPVAVTNSKSVLFNKKTNLSVNTPVTATTTTTTTKTASVPLSKKLIKMPCLKKQTPCRAVIDHLEDISKGDELKQSAIISNRLATDSISNPTSTLVLLNTAPDAVQQRMCGNISAASNVSTNTTTCISQTSPFSSTTNSAKTSASTIMQQTAFKATSKHVIKSKISQKLPAVEAPASTSLPAAQTKAFKRLASGVYNIPPESCTNSTPNVVKMYKKCVTQSAVFSCKLPTMLSPSIEEKEAVFNTQSLETSATKIPLNRYQSPEKTLTTTSGIPQRSIVQTSTKNNTALSSLLGKNMRLTKTDALKTPISTVTKSQNSATVSSSIAKAVYNDKNKKSSSSVCSITESHKNATNAAQVEPVYGYFCSNVTGYPRFLSKRIHTDYFIKVPGHGLAKANGILSANAFLNQHIAKICPSTNQKMIWNFVPQENNNSIQKKANNAQKVLPTQPKSSMESGKTITPPNINLELIPGFKQKHITKQPQQQRRQNISASSLANTVTETILIDD